MRHKLWLVSLLIAAGLFSGCENPGGTTPPPPPTGPAVICPVDITLSSDTGAALPVHFEPPMATSSHPPVSVNCSPTSDSLFPVGSNPVVCTAVDTVGQATCSFRVAVTLPPRRLKFSKIMAFGDSITQGFLRDPPEGFSQARLPLFIDPVENYPYQLQDVLRTRYGSNDIVVINEGLGGETIEDGMERIVDAMALHQPQLVLLLEGYNGLRETPLSDARSGLRAMARWAQTHGAEVLLATLFQVSDDREESRPGSQERIDDLNDLIRGLGVSLNVGVVDLERVFGTGVGLLGTDGLHPNPAGYRLIARSFADEIIRRFEEIPVAEPAPAPPEPAPTPTSAQTSRRQFIQRSGH